MLLCFSEEVLLPAGLQVIVVVVRQILETTKGDICLANTTSKIDATK